ncbi:MAG: hypothetical protein V2I24_07115 [Halieaceae bacterium]|nr:hypothetical protein [Halieaceae bacterium]
MTIEPHSTTWRAVLAFIERERRDAIENLIADQRPEQARGTIQTLERLTALARPPAPPVTSDTYD